MDRVTCPHSRWPARSALHPCAVPGRGLSPMFSLTEPWSVRPVGKTGSFGIGSATRSKTDRIWSIPYAGSASAGQAPFAERAPHRLFRQQVGRVVDRHRQVFRRNQQAPRCTQGLCLASACRKAAGHFQHLLLALRRTTPYTSSRKMIWFYDLCVGIVRSFDTNTPDSQVRLIGRARMTILVLINPTTTEQPVPTNPLSNQVRHFQEWDRRAVSARWMPNCIKLSGTMQNSWRRLSPVPGLTGPAFPYPLPVVAHHRVDVLGQRLVVQRDDRCPSRPRARRVTKDLAVAQGAPPGSRRRSRCAWTGHHSRRRVHRTLPTIVGATGPQPGGPVQNAAGRPSGTSCPTRSPSSVCLPGLISTPADSKRLLGRGPPGSTRRRCRRALDEGRRHGRFGGGGSTRSATSTARTACRAFWRLRRALARTGPFAARGLRRRDDGPPRDDRRRAGGRPGRGAHEGESWAAERRSTPRAGGGGDVRCKFRARRHRRRYRRNHAAARRPSAWNSTPGLHRAAHRTASVSGLIHSPVASFG